MLTRWLSEGRSLEGSAAKVVRRSVPMAGAKPKLFRVLEKLALRLDPELDIEIGQVSLHCAFADVEPFTDLPCCQTLDGELGYVTLSGGKGDAALAPGGPAAGLAQHSQGLEHPIASPTCPTALEDRGRRGQGGDAGLPV